MTARTTPILSTNNDERKQTPLFTALRFFPLAFAALARHIHRSNEKHNPGEPIHWAREKSTDHAECAGRHLVDVDLYNEALAEYEDAVALLWRAAAIVQLLEERRLGRGPTPGPEELDLASRPRFPSPHSQTVPVGVCEDCGHGFNYHDERPHAGALMCPSPLDGYPKTRRQ